MSLASLCCCRRRSRSCSASNGTATCLPRGDPTTTLVLSVRCRPGRRFGRPAIAGISTAAIFEHLVGGESEDEVADQFDLNVESVRWALAYETSSAGAARGVRPATVRFYFDADIPADTSRS